MTVAGARAQGEMVDRALDERLSEHGRAIMGLLREGGRLSTGEIADALGGSRPTVQRELRALQQAGAIEWVGKSTRDPRAYWRLR
jgi:ATP-dependent DNA helicase RecG